MILNAIFLGIIATVVMDLTAFAQRRLLGIPSLDYALVGRWLGHIPKGQFVHRPINQSPAVPLETALGWAVHYAIGILFAGLFLYISGGVRDDAGGPLLPLTFGAISVAAPFLLLQPAVGAGLAARRTPRPWLARSRSLQAHLSFGIGLWIGYRLLLSL